MVDKSAESLAVKGVFPQPRIFVQLEPPHPDNIWSAACRPHRNSGPAAARLFRAKCWTDSPGRFSIQL